MDKNRTKIRQKILECCQTKCTNLDLSDYRVKSITDFHELKDCIHLKNFTLSNKDYSNQHNYNFDILENLTQLETLDLSYNNISSIGFLRNLTKLKSLNLMENDSYALSWEKDIFAHLQKLESLNLRYTSIDFSILKGLVNLKTLDLSYTNVSDISFIGELGQIESLNISGNKNLLDIDVLLSKTRLKSLDFQEGRKMSIYEIVDLAKQNRLESINISHHQMGSYYEVWSKYDGRYPPARYHEILSEYKALKINPGFLKVYATFSAFREAEPTKELLAAEFVSKLILDRILMEH